MKKIIALLLALIMVFTMAACGNQAADAPAADAPAADSDQADAADDGDADHVPGDRNGDGTFTIGFVNRSVSTEFFFQVQESFEKACEERGIRLLTDVTEGDNAKMRTLWETFEMQGADIIIDFCINVEAGASLSAEFTPRIPVLTVDGAYGNGSYFFGVNNQIAGEVAGEAINAIVQEKWDGEVDAMLQIYIEETALKPRNAGVSDILLETTTLEEDDIYWVTVGPGATLSSDEVGIRSFVTDYLSAHPDDHRIVISCNNDGSAHGALAAVEAAGRMDEVLITSHNADEQAVTNLKLDGENAWACTVNYNSALYGEQCVELAQKICDGEDVPQENWALVTAVTDDNVWEIFPE